MFLFHATDDCVQVVEQAEQLGISLLGVPLHKELTIAACISKGLKLLRGDQRPLHLWFPDASVEERNKRENALSPLLLGPTRGYGAAAESGKTTHSASAAKIGKISTHFPLLDT